MTRSVYYPDNLVEYQQNGSFAQDERGIIYVGFSAGLFEFDGRNKSLTSTKSPVLALKYVSSEKKLWAACQKEAGYFTREASGELSFKSLPVKLPDSIGVENFSAEVFDLEQSVVVYYADYAIIWNKTNQSHRTVILRNADGATLGAFHYKNKVYVNAPKKGICELNESGLKKTFESGDLAFRKAIDQLSLGADSLLLATSDNRLVLFNGKTATEFQSELNYAVTSANDRVTGIASFGDYIIASTEQNGCLVMQRATGKVVSALNVRYNLADNNINAIFSDRNGRIWMAHSEQISWTYLNYPLQQFDKGLTGNVNDLVSYNRNLYVATDNGVYYFTRFSDFDMANERLLNNIIGQFEKVELPDASKVKTKPLPDYDEKIAQIQQSYEKKVDKIEKQDEGVSGVAGKLKGLFKSKKKKEEEERLEEQRRQEMERKYQEQLQAIKQQNAAAKAEREQKIREIEAQRQRELAERQKIRQLQAQVLAARQQKKEIVDFERVQNLPSKKFKALAAYNGRVVAASQSGLYEIFGSEARQQNNLPVKALMVSQRDPNRLYVLSPSNELGYYVMQDGAFFYTPLKQFDQIITSIAEDRKGNVWLGARRDAIMIDFSEGAGKPTVKRYRVQADSAVKFMENKVFGINGHIFYTEGNKVHQKKGASFVPVEEVNAKLDNSKPIKVYSGIGRAALLNGRNLHILRANTSGRLSVIKSSYVLNLLDRAPVAHLAGGDSLWLASRANVLSYEIDKRTGRNQDKSFAAFFKSVSVMETLEDGSIQPDFVEQLNETLELPYQNLYNLEFVFSAPAFDHPESVVYQYKIGEKDAWKTIENNRLSLEFTWGDYHVKVRAVDAFGNVSESAGFQFSIAKPFWLLWYFWVVVAAALIAGIVLFFRYRQRRLEQRKKELEEEVDKATKEILKKNEEMAAINVQLHQQSEELTIQNEVLEQQSHTLIEQNNQLEESHKEITRQKERSDELLLNILPKETAEELKNTGKAIARRYNMASVMFTDFKGFTGIAETMSPEELVVELDRSFQAFDEIVQRHGLEKIKTIGDGYLCAGGIPKPNTTNPIQIVLAGLEMQRYVAKVAAEKKKKGRSSWQLRLGIHTGEIVAGVVGKVKFAYDIWGDTVNTASRMESSGEPDKVNISESTYNIVKSYFVCTFRGKVPAKGKGEISMYFVERIAPEYAADADGTKPNKRLLEILSGEELTPVA